MKDIDFTVYSMIHAEYGGYTIGETAERLGVSRNEVKSSIRRIRKYTPVVILTKRERQVRNLLLEKGLTGNEMAKLLKCSPKNIERIVANLKSKGITILKRPKTVSYNSLMDNHILEKF